MSLLDKAKEVREYWQHKPFDKDHNWNTKVVSIDEVYKILAAFREDELFRIHCEVENNGYKTPSDLLKEVIKTFDNLFNWEYQPPLTNVIKKSESE